MIVTKEYANAFTEICIILQNMEEEDINKIPKDVLDVIEQNKNENYEYEMNEEIDIFLQPMLPETRAILFNFFRDYWSTPEQKQKIIEMQKEEKYKLEELKQQKYNSEDMFTKNKMDVEIENKDIDKMTSSLQVIKKDNFIIKILKKIMGILKK